ncbi:MAG: hypothetical protein Q9227_008526 [Pyrenula ochraceoflavens]
MDVFPATCLSLGSHSRSKRRERTPQGGSGIGKETAFSFAQAGVRAIVFADISETNGTQAVEDTKKYASNSEYRGVFFKVDVADEAGVQEMVDFAVKEFGRIDYAVNGAGVDNGVYLPFAESVPEDYDHVMAVNAKGLMLCVQAEIKAMLAQESRQYTSRGGTRDIGRGSIINIASANSYAGLPGKMAYVVSKHAGMGITKMAALDHAKDGIRINSVCPTWVKTPMQEEELRKNPATLDLIQRMVPCKRVADPEEVADAIVFLASPASSYINGTGLMIDGGVTLSVKSN